MKRLSSLLLFLFISFSGLSQVRIDSLPMRGVLLDKGWKWHVGDNSDWAKPNIDDRQWSSIDPTKDIMELPQVRQAGIGWFRLHLALAPTVRNESLAALIEQTGASEVYINGHLRYQFGKIDPDGRPVQTYDPRGRPVAFAVPPDSLVILAIRFAFAKNLPYTVSFARQNMNPMLRVKVSDFTSAVRYDQVNRLGGLPLDYLKIGIYFILTLLHLTLYLYYPVQRANFYFSMFALSCLLTYLLQTQSVYMDAQETLQPTRIAIGITTLLFQLLLLTALYKLFNRLLSLPYWLLFGYFFVCIPLTVWPYRSGLNYGYGLFYLLCYIEMIRITVLAVRQKKRGAVIVMRGAIVALLFGLTYTVLLPYSSDFRQQFFATGSAWYFMLIHLPYNISNQSIPVAISLYLGLEFAFTSKALSLKLVEVEELSEKTREQEAEKLQLIAEQNQQLEQTVQERTGQLRRLYTNLTHEFRTPLTLILGPAEQVMMQVEDPKTRQQIGLIQRNGQRLLRLINQLLDLSKLEAGRMEVTQTPGDLVNLIRGTLLSFETLAHQNQVALQFTTAQERLDVALDRDKWEKILSNLFANALKFTPAGGNVRVALTRDQIGETDWVTLTVEDTGVGIPADKLPYIYDRFYQVDASDTKMPGQRAQEGTGIGLALTKELVEVLGGSIQIESQEGTGTMVTVRLPIQIVMLGEITPEIDVLVTDVDDPTLVSSVSSIVPPNDALLVLVIEDNDDVRMFIHSSIGHQYRILEAANGEEGVRLAQQQVPDLIITDLMMPKLNGYEVCTTLRNDERTSHIPVIMLTAKADLNSKLEGLETGADAYLAKPFNQRELLTQTANLIRLRQQLRERYSQENLWITDDSKLPSMEQAFLDRVRTAIEAHLDDEQYSVERLSDDVGLSRTQLHRKLKATLNQSPGDLIRLVRLERARTLLQTNIGTVAEVAYKVGFSNPANFSTSFSNHFGYAPSDVKKKVSSLS